MHLTDLPTHLCLPPGELLAWRPPRHVTITVQAGQVWVTRENDVVDHILHPGARLLLPRGALACISTEIDSHLEVLVLRSRWHTARQPWQALHRLVPMRR